MAKESRPACVVDVDLHIPMGFCAECLSILTLALTFRDKYVDLSEHGAAKSWNELAISDSHDDDDNLAWQPLTIYYTAECLLPID